MGKASLTEYFRMVYGDIFVKAWPAWFAGFGVGAISTLMFVYARPWTVDAGVRLWGSWLLAILGVRLTGELASPLLDSTSILNMGLLGGAFVGALLSKEFAIRIPRREGAMRGLGGGLLMGVGAAVTPGCNIGGFFTPFIAMSASGIGMMIGLIVGSYAGAKVLLWEVKRMRTDGGSTKRARPLGLNPSLQPLIAMGFVLLVIAAVMQYQGIGYPSLGGLLLLSALLGLFLQRSKFCFASAFRELFVTGDGSFARASIVALLVGLIGFATVISAGVRPWALAANPTGLHTLLGGIIFGFGMVIAGGCASGSIWRAGEGQVQLWIALLGFMLSGAVFPYVLERTGFDFGPRLFLPALLGWAGALLVSALVVLAWFVMVCWAEVRRSG